MAEDRNKTARLVLVLLIIGAMSRLILLATRQPFLGDSRYTDAALEILRFDFRGLEGDRPPVYPLLLALCGLNYKLVCVVQFLLGLTASLMIFDMAFRRTRHGLCSLVVGLACSLIPNVLIYESDILTETLASFLLVTSLWLITRSEGATQGNFWFPLGVGLSLALAGLTRPLLLGLIPVYYCFMVPIWPPARFARPDSLRRTLLFFLPVVVLVFGWCGFNYVKNGFFTPTTLAGQNLMDQVDPYVELAPDKFAVVRDTWLEHQRHYGPPERDVEGLYWEAMPDLQKRTGKSPAQVSHELTSLALYLYTHHPLVALRRAEQGWIRFWGEASPDEIEWPQGHPIGALALARPLAKFLVREVMAVLLILSLLSVPCALFHWEIFTRFEYLVFAITQWTSVVAAFTEFGDNHRFAVPFLPLIFCAVLTWGWSWIIRRPRPS